VIVPDVNVLLHAYNPRAAGHAEARRWWEGLLAGEESVGLAWVVVLGFLRISTNRVYAERPATLGQAIGWVRSWLAMPTVRILVPGDAHPELLFRLLEETGVAGNLTTDAHIAALALEWRAEVATTDTDFARFAKVRWSNPLKKKRK
jgi:toxin-antitoxin system PIN domain toxin